MYAENRSLWYDEAALALNITSRGFVELVAPLDYLQTAPPMFLWAERLVVILFGANDWTLRLVPLGAGVVTAPVTWVVARRLLDAPSAVLAVALVALSPSLVRYAAEVKPYASDALVTLVLLHYARAAVDGDATLGPWRSLAIAGVVAILSSTPSVFVLAGVIAFTGARSYIMRDMRLARRTAALAGTWVSIFAVLLATVFRPLLGESTAVGKFMHWYWATNFLTTEPPGIKVKALALTWAALPATFLGDGAFRGATTVLVAGVAVGFVVLLVQRKLPLLLLLVVPIVSLVAASMLRRYPIAERLILFAAPLSALLISASQLAAATARARRVGPWINACVAAALVALAGRGVVERLRSDDGRQETRALIREAVAAHSAGTPLWISRGGEVAWRYYTTTAGQRRIATQAAETSALGGRALAPDVLVGAWFSLIPERILTVVDDTAEAAKPSAWSLAEANRVRAVARPCTVIFLTHMRPGESRSIITALVQRGGTIVYSRRERGAELHRVCFRSDSNSARP